MIRRGGWVGFVLIVGLFAVSTVQAAVCKGDRYLVRGAIRDDAGRSVADAEVYVLLDKISQKKFLERGVRARSFRADRSGRYAAAIVCGGEDGRPNPCGRKPGHVTVAATGPGHGLKLTVFKLKDLPVTDLGGECIVEVPGIILGRRQ